MCGRFDMHAEAAEVAAAFGVQGEIASFRPRFNIAPTHAAPVVLASPTGALVLRCAGFGWRVAFARGGVVLNARAETARGRPLFRGALRTHRCVVPAHGFYEWDKSTRPRQPWYFASRRQPLVGIAGLLRPGDPQESEFVLLTTRPNDCVARLHDRMPVLLDPQAAERFLRGSVEDATEQLVPYPSEAMRAHRVSARVNRPGYEGADCVDPVSSNGA